jgi:hypothetical protein
MRFLTNILLLTLLVAADCAAKQSSDRDYVRVGPSDSLSMFKDVRVIMEGRLAAVPWQHLIRIPEGCGAPAYLDFGENRQTVLYSKEPISCPASLTVWGRVIEIRGESKRPGSDAPTVEYQILVDRWECAK